MARKLPVKWFNYDVMSGAGGAPQLNGLAGSLIQVLDACLIDGFNTRSVVSFIIAGGVGTIEFGTSGHGFVLHQVVGIGGATDDQYNGDWRVTAVNTTSIKVDATGVADTTVAGTLTCKTAPVGDWEKAFSGTNKAAYRSTHADATGLLLRVDDSVGVYANVRGYETMSDIDTGTGEFPTVAQKATAVWNKANTANSTALSWVVTADAMFFYLTMRPVIGSGSNANLHCIFGDINSYKASDQYHAIIIVSDSTTATSSFNQNRLNGLITSDLDYVSCARSYTQTGSAISCMFKAPVATSGFSLDAFLPSYPSPLDNSLVLSDFKIIQEPTTRNIRGNLPGFLNCHQRAPLEHGNIITDALGAGRHVMMIGGATGYNSSQYYRYALDIIGGWR